MALIFWLHQQKKLVTRKCEEYFKVSVITEAITSHFCFIKRTILMTNKIYSLGHVLNTAAFFITNLKMGSCEIKAFLNIVTLFKMPLKVL